MASNLPMARRRGFGSKGKRVKLFTNFFKVTLGKKDGFFYQYTVSLVYENGHPVQDKGVWRRVIDQVIEGYSSQLKNTNFAYDGGTTLFTLSSFQLEKFEMTVALDKISFKVEIRYIKRIAFSDLESASQEALMVLHIILIHHAAKRGCLRVHGSFFHDEIGKDIGGGVQACRGFHSSFRLTQNGLLLNTDVTTTLLLKPGPVLGFLCENQNVNHPSLINWGKAKWMLKNMRMKANNIEYKMTGLSDESCRNQLFSFKQGRDANGEVKSTEMTVSEYFIKYKGLKLQNLDFPCIKVGKPNKPPSYFPIELCTLVSLQSYTKALTSSQAASFVKVSRQNPGERMTSVKNSLRNRGYGKEPMLCSSAITIDSQCIQVDGRVLCPPELKAGNGSIIPRGGKWNFNYKRFVHSIGIDDRWAVANFSPSCNTTFLTEGLRKCARMKEMVLKDPLRVLTEPVGMRHKPVKERVMEMYKNVTKELNKKPLFLLCILPDKQSDIYGPWKKLNLTADGIAGGLVTQCTAPKKMDDSYFHSLLMKINVKLGGTNSFLASESIHMVSTVPTLILGMDVWHGSGRPGVPSIAAVVSSRNWPRISNYRAVVRAQSPRVEMISNLCKPVSNTKDDGIFRELLDDFMSTSNRKPHHIVIFRDGVSDSEMNEVLDSELNQIIQACKHYERGWDPKFTVIIAQKRHYTRFLFNATENVQPGTIVDRGICHPTNNDFYMCAHGGTGTLRPIHYHVIRDDIGFSADDLQEFVHSLCYVSQKATSATSLVAPIYYAHLAAAQVANFINFDELSESSSSQVPELPRIHDQVRRSMFFC